MANPTDISKKQALTPAEQNKKPEVYKEINPQKKSKAEKNGKQNKDASTWRNKN